MAKKLFRSWDNRYLFGVCGGIGDYLDVDPTVIRVLFVIMSLAWFLGIFVYIIAALIMPLNPKAKKELESKRKTKK
jgi:phage shock protein C